ncbi:MAG: hypothetical protein KF832_18220 [Caldilineaceae bacterium]|nr:hypothetical protein [Caldilineaceae bacterium]
MTNIDVVPESIYKSSIQAKPHHLWLGLLTGPVLYALYFIVGYLLVEAACQLGFLQETLGGIPFYSLCVLALTLVVALITTLVGVASWRRWRQNAYPLGDDPDQAVPFLLFGSVLLSALFTLLMILTGISVLLIQACRWV